MENRDLASHEVWQRSLERSRRRRVLAASARKEQSRRKTASLAVSAAVAAAPMWPSVAGTAGDVAKADTGKSAKKPGERERILLEYGDTSSAVSELQHALQIAVDGIFGPQTRGAVRAFQQRAGLPVTGDVDPRTWLALFPHDAVVYAPGSGTGSGASAEPHWAAVSTEGMGAGAAGAGGARRGAPAGSDAAGTTTAVWKPEAKARHADVHAASFRAAGLLGRDDGASGSAPIGPVTLPLPLPRHGSKGNGLPPLTGGLLAPPRGGSAPPVVPLLPRGGSIGQMISAMIAAANRIDRSHYAYRWGGGHNSSFSGPYDCSGAVSAVLHAAGLLSSPLVSGGFTHWGAPGRGAVTIYANASHVYMSIGGRFFGTSRANPGGGAGWFRGGARAGFVVVHVPFERMHVRNRSASKKRATRRLRRRARINAPRTTLPQTARTSYGTAPTNGGTAAPTYRPPASSTPSTTPAPTYQPPASTVTPAAPAAPVVAPVVRTVGSIGQGAPAYSQPQPTSVPAAPTTGTQPSGPPAGGNASPGAGGPTNSVPAPQAGGGQTTSTPQGVASPSGSNGPAPVGGAAGSGRGSAPTPAASGAPAPQVSGIVNGAVAGASGTVKSATSTTSSGASQPQPAAAAQSSTGSASGNAASSAG